MGENNTPDHQQPEQPDYREHQQPPPPPEPPRRAAEPPQQPPPPQQAQVAPSPAPQAHKPARRRRGSRFLRVLVGGLLLVSLVMNAYLLLLVAAHMTGPFETTVVRKGERNQTIAVYDLSGIIDGRSAGSFNEFCLEIGPEQNVRAVVLRVDSPGGGVAAADQIHRLVRDLRNQGKKVVVSMGAVAASGGYYVSAPADEILAEPTSITGSIGVMMQWFVLEGTLEKLGVEPIVMRSDDSEAWKDQISVLEPPQQHHRERLQEVLDTMHDRFEKIVREGRQDRLKTTTSTLEIQQDGQSREVTVTEPFSGNIYLADEAKELGLIDEIGYTDSAIDRAASLAGLTDPHVVRYKVRRPLVAHLLGRGPDPTTLIEPETIDQLRTPRMMLLWKVE